MSGSVPTGVLLAAEPPIVLLVAWALARSPAGSLSLDATVAAQFRAAVRFFEQR
jgi:hypothetical protein